MAISSNKIRLGSPLFSRAAQITLPAILLIPTILLVIYLLFETTKLSREKVRHQFALDSSAFVELTSTSNYLNAVAYTNGAFPFRLFRENFPPEPREIPKNPARAYDGPDTVSIFDAFHEAGAFPTMYDPQSAPQPTDTEWELEFYRSTKRDEDGWNTENPDPARYREEEYPVTSRDIAENYLFEWNIDAVKLYMFMYYLLSQIYENQKSVYDRVSAEGEFFRKSYYLNIGGTCPMAECGRQGAREFKGFLAQTEPVYINKIIMYFTNVDDGSNEVLEIPMDLEQDQIFDGRLYQFSFLTRQSRDRMRQLYMGIDITQPFQTSSNYFNVALAKYNPRNHVRVALQCTKQSNNCVWPNPTSKYQVRTFP